MTYEHFEHEADIGVRGFGKTLAESLEECAKAMFTVMCNIEKVTAEKEIDVKVNGIDETALLINWLNELLAMKDIEDMMFSDFQVHIDKTADGFMLQGKAIGEETNREKHELETEVKAATFHVALVKQEGEKWIAQCIVDV